MKSYLVSSPRRGEATKPKSKSKMSRPMKSLFRCITSLLYICHSPCLSQLPTDERNAQIQKLRQRAYANPESEQSIQAWERVLIIDPTNLEAHVLLGWTLITTPPHQERGIQLLEASFDSARVTPTVDISLPQTYVIAATIGRYRSQKKE